MDILLFTLDGHRYGLSTIDVQEVVRAVAIAPLPKAPPIVEGVIDARGRLVPVLDIRSRFRLLSKALSPSDFFVLARRGDRLVALRVEPGLALAQIAEIDTDSLEPIVSGTDYVAGVARHPDGLVLIHDLQTFLDAAEAAQLAEALEEACASPEEQER